MIPDPSLVELGPFSAEDATLTPWAVAHEALHRTQKFWLSTVRDDGRPHVTGLLAAIALDGICFVTGSNEQKSRNLHRNPQVVITTGVNTLTGTDYVIEGVASLITRPDDLAEAARAFELTLGWQVLEPDGTWYGMTDAIRDASAELWRISPTKGFAQADTKAASQTRYVWTA